MKQLFFLLICSLFVAHTLNSQCNSDDFNALRTLYLSTDGDNWTNNTGWDLVRNNATPPVGCDLGAMFGVTTSSGRVTILNLSSNKLNGSLPVELGDLAELQQFRLFKNQLKDTIPAALGGLDNLLRIDLYDNQLSGSIPSELGQLLNLRILWLFDNQLSGSIPVELGNLSDLQRLRLDQNQLSGSIPSELGQLSDLIDLYLNLNQLSGAFPAELGQLSNLDNLLLWGNQLSGCFAPELNQLCIQNTSVTIDNSFDATWADFCASGAGVCAPPLSPPIPTMSQWAMLLFGLIVVTLGVVGVWNLSAAKGLLDS